MRRRGWAHNEGLIDIALAAMALAVIIPTAGQIHARLPNRDTGGLGAVVMAFTGAVGIIVLIFWIIPGILALPVAGVAKLTKRRDERYRYLLAEYQSIIAVGILVLLLLCGVVAPLWKSVVSPLLQMLQSNL